MKRTFTLIFGLSFVLYLSGTALAQGKVGGPQPAHRDVDNNKTHGKADAREDGKEGNFIARIQRNPELSEKLQTLLPKTGPNSTLAGAAMGFRNEGQFIAALHVSKNLGIPFDQLKATMLGTTPQLTATTAGATTTGSTTTGSKAMSLGQAIHTLQPRLSEKDAHKEADTAQH